MSYAVTLLDFAHRAPSGVRALALISLAATASATSASSRRATWARVHIDAPNDLIWITGRTTTAGEQALGSSTSCRGTRTGRISRPAAQPFPRHIQAQLVVPDGRGSPSGDSCRPCRHQGADVRRRAMTDHLTRGKAAIAPPAAQWPTTFVLSNSGHIQSLVNPPGTRRRRTTPATSRSDPSAAGRRDRSLRLLVEEWSTWMADRSGDQCDAPRSLGSALNPPVDEAPGRYVRESAHGEGAPRELVPGQPVTDHLGTRSRRSPTRPDHRFLIVAPDQPRASLHRVHVVVGVVGPTARVLLGSDLGVLRDRCLSGLRHGARPRGRCPSQEWFTGSRLSYAEHMLRAGSSDEVAVIAVEEGQPPSRRPGGSCAGRSGRWLDSFASWACNQATASPATCRISSAALVSMLATTSIGAVWTVCSPDFGFQASWTGSAKSNRRCSSRSTATVSTAGVRPRRRRRRNWPSPCRR